MSSNKPRSRRHSYQDDIWLRSIDRRFPGGYTIGHLQGGKQKDSLARLIGLLATGAVFSFVLLLRLAWRVGVSIFRQGKGPPGHKAPVN